ncbi:MAG: Trp family transcriptional regulator [Treponemataceae bacterium]
MEREFDEKTQNRIKEGFDELEKVLFSIKDEKLFKDFLDCILSPSEKFDLGKRWLSVRELNYGTTQREIASQFKMSLCKITRGSRELKKENSAFKKTLEMIDKGELL